jgi:hypothetical protein
VAQQFLMQSMFSETLLDLALTGSVGLDPDKRIEQLNNLATNVSNKFNECR